MRAGGPIFIQLPLTFLRPQISINWMVTWVWYLSEWQKCEHCLCPQLFSWLYKPRTALQPTEICISNHVFCCCTESALAGCLGVYTLQFDKYLVPASVWNTKVTAVTVRIVMKTAVCVSSHQFLQAFTDDLIRSLSVWLTSLWLAWSLCCCVQPATK